MSLSFEQTKNEITQLLGVPVDDPKWSKSALLDLLLVTQQFESGKEYGLKQSDASTNLALCLLQALNDLVPPDALAPIADWIKIVGAEINAIGRVRQFVASVLADRFPGDPPEWLSAGAEQSSYSPNKFGNLPPASQTNVIRKAIAAIWLWKTGENPFVHKGSKVSSEPAWRDLFDKLRIHTAWASRAVYEFREEAIGDLAKFISSNQDGLQKVGVGPTYRAIGELGTKRLAAEAVLHTDGAPVPVVTTSESSKSDTVELYLANVLPPAPTYIPDEWQTVLKASATSRRLFIQGEVGSGKTNLLYAIGHELKKAAQVPLYIRVSDYAPHAANMDILHFAAYEGTFWQTFHDEALSREFAKALAAALRADRLVVIVDQCDDLFENELSKASRSLNTFPRLILAERSPRLLIDRVAAATINLPALSLPSLLELAGASGMSGLHESELVELQQQGLELNPAIVGTVARVARASTDRHAVVIIGAWIDGLLHRARSTDTIVAEADKAHRVLQKLAHIHQRIDWPRSEPNDLIRDNVPRFFRDPALQLKNEDEGLMLLDLCTRAGLLTRDQETWRFVNATIERFFTAEYAASIPWTSLWPRHRELMAWVTAILTRHGSDREQERFFAQLKLTLERSTDLSTLEVLDILDEAGFSLPAASDFKDETLRRFRDLAKIESDAVRFAVQKRAEGHDLNVGLTRRYEPPESLIPGNVLDDYAYDLPELLRHLGLKQPKGREGEWLDNRGVLNGLLEALRAHREHLIRYQCAGWLRRSSLSKVTEIQIPSQLLKSRTLSALEVLAEIASDPSENVLIRVLAKSVLAKDEFIVRLWTSRKEYVPLVYELLLATEKRLFAGMPSPYQREWRVYG